MNEMNEKIARVGSLIVSITVAIFAVCMLIDFSFGSFFICMILPIGFIMMTSGFYNECESSKKVAAMNGVIFATIYAVLIVIVYFAQTTTVRLETLTPQASQILDFNKGGLLFNYDLLGYGFMALSTFFTGLTIEDKMKSDKVLKWLMLIHGIFFIACLIMPMTGIFVQTSDSDSGIGGVIALECWCAYFIPVGILSFIHFKKRYDEDYEVVSDS
ncbi:MAG: hypothetical protein ACI4D4_06030 [Lachnospira sp.]